MEKKKLRIGIDLDDVVFEFTEALVKNFNEKYKKDFRFGDVFSYYFPEVFKIDIPEMRRFVDNMINEDFHLGMELCNFAKESILDLSLNKDIYFITSRFYTGGTLESLQKHFSDFELIFSSNPYLKTEGLPKSKICIENKIDFMIEDSPEHAKDCADAGIKVLLLDKPWNQNFEHENVVRVSDWRDVKKKIEEFSKEDSVVENVRKFVEDECKKPTSKYGYSPYPHHFIPVRNYAIKLADKLDLPEDKKEIIEISAWLHDIGSIVCGRENHHITGSEIAGDKLRDLGYPEDKIKIVKKCILNHRGSVGNFLESVEEQILVDTDCMSAFENIEGLFECALVWEKKDRYEAKKSVRQKLINKWKQLSPEGKELIKPKYEAAMLLLE